MKDVPIPIKIPPYIHAKNLSDVNASYRSNKSIKKDKNAVPKMLFITKSFPILINAKIKNIN